MKLHEVVDFQRQKSPEDVDDYSSRLRDMRIRRLSSGAYASVYQHPKIKKVVVKVSDEASGNLAWLKFVATHQGNPYVPKIYDLRRYKGTRQFRRDEYFIVMMERLNEYYKHSQNQKLAILQKHFGAYFTKRNFQVDAFEGLVGDEETLEQWTEQSRATGKPSPALLEVLRFIWKRPRGADWDVRDANIMLRGKDQIVFTDPLE